MLFAGSEKGRGWVGGCVAASCIFKGSNEKDVIKLLCRQSSTLDREALTAQPKCEVLNRGEVQQCENNNETGFV